MSVIAEVYLANAVFVAELPVPPGERLSQWVNAFPGAITTIHMAQALDDRETISTGHEAVMRARDMRLIRPIQEPPAGRQSDVLERVHCRVALETPPYHVWGDLHLLDRIRWVDFLMSMQNRFLAITNAVLVSPGHPEGQQHDVVLVNAAHISLFYELT